MNWHEIFEYKDGELFWKVRTSNRVNVGDVAGSHDPLGYVRVNYKNIMYQAHRIIWEMHNDDIDDGLQIDHIDLNPSNNRIENLRTCTHQQNNWNKNSKGFCIKNGKYVSRITISGKEIYLGRFDCMLDARAAYLSARKKYFGEFA